ncbi:MAG: 3-dehydroquinate synthase [Thermoanaerobaculia bacterium]|nr:3-dehydroquinate synthase [Thermoanaerobaculia bacterium]
MTARAAERLSLSHPRGESAIWCGAGALAAAGEELRAWAAGRRLFVLSSPRVRALHGAALDPVRAAAAAVEELSAPDGEAAKTIGEAERLWREMAARGGRRDSRLLCLGGGSLTDLGGFVAGAFLRGIEVAHCPTTLLAQVDAAIGGKTAVDLPEGKNLVGLFHHPALVVAEAAWLATLSREALREGLAEVVKVAALLAPDLLARVERDLDRLLAGEALGPVVSAAARAKAEVVARDPEERGERALLNFGHTLGHALETAAGHGALAHGDAVAWGIRFALLLARDRGWASDLAPRLETLLDRLAPPALPPLEPAAVLAALGRDKKGVEAGPRWVLPESLGRGRWGIAVPPDAVAGRLAGFLAAARSGSLRGL